MASSNKTKNTDYKRKNFADSLDKGQMAEVMAKLDTVQNLIKKQVSFAEGVETEESAAENGDKDDVNFVSGTSF